jgi:glycosyltransferase involved in cell wall biosynthesis
VAANKGQPDRKAFQANLRAWAAFAEETPGARLYLHTDPTPQAGGVNIEALTRALGIDGQVIYPDRYTYYNIGYPAEWMALLYNAVDVLLAASMTEGFGIPLIEAQACGTPVVTTDFASMTELVYFGWATRPADLFWSPLDAWWAWPDVVEIEQRLEWSRTMPAAWPAEWCKMRHAASQTIHELYSWDVLVERYWAQLLEAIAVG